MHNFHIVHIFWVLKSDFNQIVKKKNLQPDTLVMLFHLWFWCCALSILLFGKKTSHIIAHVNLCQWSPSANLHSTQNSAKTCIGFGLFRLTGSIILCMITEIWVRNCSKVRGWWAWIILALSYTLLPFIFSTWNENGYCNLYAVILFIYFFYSPRYSAIE